MKQRHYLAPTADHTLITESLTLPLPASTVRVEMEKDEDSFPHTAHIKLPQGTISVSVYAVPRSDVPWLEENGGHIIDRMARDGYQPMVRRGRFGDEIVGVSGDDVARIVVVQGLGVAVRFTVTSRGGVGAGWDLTRVVYGMVGGVRVDRGVGARVPYGGLSMAIVPPGDWYCLPRERVIRFHCRRVCRVGGFVVDRWRYPLRLD